MMQCKTCRICGREFYRKENQTDGAWRKQKRCSRSCHGLPRAIREEYAGTDMYFEELNAAEQRLKAQEGLNMYGRPIVEQELSEDESDHGEALKHNSPHRCKRCNGPLIARNQTGYCGQNPDCRSLQRAVVLARKKERRLKAKEVSNGHRAECTIV